MKAELITQFKSITDNSITQMTIWKVPEPVPPSTHSYKYSLVYIVDGQRVIGYDNERGKGDHLHLDGKETPYAFTNIERLIEDFIAEVAKRRN
jgi:predicted alpha/beta superfamily hydrolase